MPVNKEDANLLFIMPLQYMMTMVGYTNGRIEVYDMPPAQYLTWKQAIQMKGYKAPVIIEQKYLYPIKAKRDIECCWIHADVISGQNIRQYIHLFERYHMTISVEQILKICVRGMEVRV